MMERWARPLEDADDWLWFWRQRFLVGKITKRQIHHRTSEMRKFLLYRVDEHSHGNRKAQALGIIIRFRMRGNIRNYALQQLPRDRIPVVIYNKPDHAEGHYFYMKADRTPSFLSVIRMIDKICPVLQKGDIGGNIMQRLPFITAIKHRQERRIDILSVSAEAGNINACIIVPVLEVSLLHLIEASIFTAYRYKCSFDDVTC